MKIHVFLQHIPEPYCLHQDHGTLNGIHRSQSSPFSQNKQCHNGKYEYKPHGRCRPKHCIETPI